MIDYDEGINAICIDTEMRIDIMYLSKSDILKLLLGEENEKRKR